MAIRRLPWRALLLAPLASVPALTILGLGSSDAGLGSDIGLGLLFGVMIGLPVSYAGMVLVGLPVYILLRRFDLVRPWTIAAPGMLLPLALFHDAPFRAALGAVGTGLAISLAAYCLLPRPELPPGN